MQKIICMRCVPVMYMSKPKEMNSTVNYSNQHIMDKTVMKLAWTAAMDCTTKTYTMMIKSFIDMRKVVRRHLYVMLEIQLK